MKLMKGSGNESDEKVITKRRIWPKREKGNEAKKGTEIEKRRKRKKSVTNMRQRWSSPR